MFKGLFKSAWQSDSVEKRLNYISDVDASVSANQSILEKLATSDADATVRQAAISKISQLQTLYKLWQSDQHIDDRGMHETALKNLLQSGDVKEAVLDTFLQENPSAKMMAARYYANEDFRKRLLLSLDEHEQSKIISEIPFSATRIMLAEKINSIDALEVARKNLKGKDKNAEKIIKAKIDAFHTQQKRENENQILAKSIREKMEALARYVTWSDEIKDKFFTLSKQWDSLDFEPSSEEKSLYGEAYVKVKADVKSNMAFILAKEGQQTIVNRLEQIAKTMADYPLNKLITERNLISNEVNELSLQWKAESSIVTPTETKLNQFTLLSKAINAAVKMAETASHSADLAKNDESEKTEQQVNQANDQSSEHGKQQEITANKQAKALLHASKSVNWPDDLPKLTAVTEAIDSAEKTLNISRQSRKEAKQALDKVHQKINRLFGIAKRGEISRANRELESITKAAENYEGFDKVKLDERIEEVTETVRKMGDWKDFAIEPKLIELCEKMEQLPALEKQSKNPSANHLANKIKDLQDQWKKMGSSDISESYWPRFKEAADIAYEPCAEFFAKRKEIQSANLEKREPFIQQMQELFESTDWDAKPDYKVVEDSVFQIMQSWKKIKDVEHSKGQKQWEKFSAIKDKINEKLDIEYDKNIKSKHALIEHMEALSEQETTEQTLDTLKFQQSKWRQIGVTRRKQDQKAWVKFKAASDAVYNKIQGVREEKRAVEDEQIDAYKNIHKQIHELAKTTQDLAVSDKEFEALELQYKELPKLPSNLPEKLIERLNKDYSRACDAYGNAKNRLNQAKLDQELEKLANKAALCADLEQLPKTAKPADIEVLEEQINNLEIANKDYLKRFEKRLKQARNPDRNEYTEARRLLLIDFEILLDIESPKEDKDLRLQIQLDRMKQQGLGNVALDKTEKLKELKLEWLCLPGAEAKVQQGFDKRFDQLMK